MYFRTLNLLREQGNEHTLCQVVLDFSASARNITLVEPASRHLPKTMADIRYARFFWTFGMALAMLLFFADPASAQDQTGRSYGEPTVPQSSGSSSVGLPSWAEPKSSSNAGGGPADPITNAPPPPPPPPVPVDGGLALLAAAGAGYAVRRLRKGQRDDVGEPVA